MSFLRKINNFFEDEWQMVFVLIIITFVMSISLRSMAVEISGEDLSSDMETVGSLFKTADTITFGWVSPLVAGVFVIIGCIGLVRSHALLFFLCMGAAVIILLVPKIVGEIKRKGGDSVLSYQLMSVEGKSQDV